MKRLLDILAALLGIVLLSPLLMLVVLLIKLTSKGPILYRGVRIGRHGAPFEIFKFRTMVANAESLGSTATAHNDPRVTGVGKFLRKFKIDEFPQLFNVLRGEMSVVGPRPEVEEHTSCYNEEEKIILSVLPGITDNSSIRFIRLNELLGEVDPNRVFIEKYRPEKNRLRVEYVKNQSFWGDIKIIFETLFSLVRLGKK